MGRGPEVWAKRLNFGPGEHYQGLTRLRRC